MGDGGAVVPSISRPLEEIEVGDLVFRKGDGLWTKFFVNKSSREKRFSHVGIVVSNCMSKITIAHAEAGDWTGVGDVHLQDWNGFFDGALDCAVYRLNGDVYLRNRIAKNAENYIGVPFDNLFDMDNTNRLYCTEFVRLCVNNAVGTNLIGWTESKAKKIIALDDIYRRGFHKVYDVKD